MSVLSYTAPQTINFVNEKPDKPASGDAYIDQASLELRVFNGKHWVGVKGSAMLDTSMVYAPYVPLYHSPRPQPQRASEEVAEFEEV